MPPASARVMEAWWRLAPEAFRVLRDRLDSVAGFYISLSWMGGGSTSRSSSST